MRVNSVTITRSGRLIQAVYGDFHCGPESELKTIGMRLHQGYVVKYLPINYTISAVCANKLDPNGFLFDQMEVDQWMQARETIPTNKSCELLALHTGQEFVKWVHSKHPGCDIKKLVVTLSPSPYSAQVSVEFGK